MNGNADTVEKGFMKTNTMIDILRILVDTPTRAAKRLGERERGKSTKDTQQIFCSLKFSLCLKEHVVMGKNLSHFFTDTWSVIS